VKVLFRITSRLVDEIRLDLRRPHPFAFERVGFVYCRFGKSGMNDLLLLAFDYKPVAEEHYVDDPSFGAVIDTNAFREVMQHLHDQEKGAFHVHMHDHRGVPQPSTPDFRETAKFVPDFFHARRNLPHGALILSTDKLSGRVWMGERKQPIPITDIKVIGAPLLSFSGVK